MSKDSKLKHFFKAFWNLVWKDDSWKGWVVSLIFIFVMVKFVFFPALYLVTGTKLPLVVVESCSMYHPGNLVTDFDDWWTTHESRYQVYNISKEEFEAHALKNGFNKGDIILSLGVNPDDLEKGDIIIFNAGQNHPIIHRVIKINDQKTFETWVDNNNGQLPVEKSISNDKIISRAVFKVPYIGWIKLLPVNLLTQQKLTGC